MGYLAEEALQLIDASGPEQRYGHTLGIGHVIQGQTHERVAMVGCQLTIFR